MLLKEIIQRIQSLYSKGVESDDTRLSTRHIYNKVLTSRSKILTQKLNKKQIISRWNYQTINCLALEKAPKIECECMEKFGCFVYKSVEALPKPITGYTNSYLTSVTTADFTRVISETTLDAQRYKSGNPHTKYNLEYYIKNGYLYVIGSGVPALVAITGLFDNPIEVFNFTSFCESEDECLDMLDMEFPIDNEDIDLLVEFAHKELIVQFNQSKEDATNDTRDNIIEETK